MGIRMVVMLSGLMLTLVVGMVTLAAVMGIPTTCRSDMVRKALIFSCSTISVGRWRYCSVKQ